MLQRCRNLDLAKLLLRKDCTETSSYVTTPGYVSKRVPGSLQQLRPRHQNQHQHVFWTQLMLVCRINGSIVSWARTLRQGAGATLFSVRRNVGTHNPSSGKATGTISSPTFQLVISHFHVTGVPRHGTTSRACRDLSFLVVQGVDGHGVILRSSWRLHTEAVHQLRHLWGCELVTVLRLVKPRNQISQQKQAVLQKFHTEKDKDKPAKHFPSSAWRIFLWKQKRDMSDMSVRWQSDPACWNIPHDSSSVTAPIIASHSKWWFSSQPCVPKGFGQPMPTLSRTSLSENSWTTPSFHGLEFKASLTYQIAIGWS